LAEVVPLSEAALIVLKECQLSLSFDSFRDHSHMQVVAHADHRGTDTGVVRIAGNPAHERPIDYVPSLE
jgi:hypothetical protein